jgi:hypothetical protein
MGEAELLARISGDHELADETRRFPPHRLGFGMNRSADPYNV